jgi:potassium/hydrogen antiporter
VPVTDVTFGALVLACAGAFMVAILSSRISAYFRIPAPAVFLIGAAIASNIFPALSDIPILTTQRLVTLALVIILFDGGMHIGWARFRSAAAPVVWLGVAGTVVTAGGIAVLAHWLFALTWMESLLLGTALAPTDPAVVFSVLGGREVGGRAGLLLEGESGANDPVGIALMVALLGAHASGWAAFGHGLLEFVLQMVVGGAIGIAGGYALRWFMQSVDLPHLGLDSVRALAGAFAIYGVATVARGSGFLAVLVAGMLLGDADFKRSSEVRLFHNSMASISEIVAFVVLGLTVDLRTVLHQWAWLIGLTLAILLAFVVRPLLCGLVLWPISLERGERLFVLWSGLKGAVPVLLGVFILAADVADQDRLYAVIFVVVAFSVIVQGGLVPTVARRLGVPMEDPL